MASAPIPKAILTFAIPTVLSTIISLLYNLTDTYFIGLLDDSVQLGAVSLAFPVFMVLQALGNMFGNGAPSYISRCLGAGEYDQVRRTSAVSVYASVLMTAVITIAGLLYVQMASDLSTTLLSVLIGTQMIKGLHGSISEAGNRDKNL